MLSEHLHSLIADASDESLPYHREKIMLWNWKRLYWNQPDDVIQAALNDINEAVNNQTLNVAQMLVLAWKAEALESLLTD